MKIFSMIASALAAAGGKALSAVDALNIGNNRAAFHRGPTQSKRRRTKNIPENYYGYPGAKLARKALMKQVAVKHPRGLRADGVTI